MSELLNSQSCKSLARYDIVSMIGRSSGSCVYKIRCLKTGKFAALKVIEKSTDSFEKTKRRLSNETDIHVTLQHPNVLRLYNHFEDNDNYYLLLELCERGDLSSYLKSTGPLSEDKIRKIGREIAEGIRYLHSNRVLHRDLKLCNILIADDGAVKICDFGLAVKLKDDSEERETLCGTPNYISPEIVNKHSYNQKADCWAFGCILYALATGNPPFEGRTVKETLQKIQQFNFKLPQKLSPQFKDLLQSLISPDTSKRLDSTKICQHPFFQAPSAGSGNFHKRSASTNIMMAENSSIALNRREVLKERSHRASMDYSSSQKENTYLDRCHLDNCRQPTSEEFVKMNNGKQQNIEMAAEESSCKPNSSSTLHRRRVSSIVTSEIAKSHLPPRHESGIPQPNFAQCKSAFQSQAPTPKILKQVSRELDQTSITQSFHSNDIPSSMYSRIEPDAFDFTQRILEATLDQTSHPSCSEFEATSRFGHESFNTDEVEMTRNHISHHSRNVSIDSNLFGLRSASQNRTENNKRPDSKYKYGETKTQKTPLMPLTTDGLKPMKLSPPNAVIQIDSNGWLLLELTKQKRIMKISPNGHEICWVRPGGRLDRSYNIKCLPEKYAKFYVYAKEICDTIRNRLQRSNNTTGIRAEAN